MEKGQEITEKRRKHCTWRYVHYNVGIWTPLVHF